MIGTRKEKKRMRNKTSPLSPKAWALALALTAALGAGCSGGEPNAPSDALPEGSQPAAQDPGAAQAAGEGDIDFNEIKEGAPAAEAPEETPQKAEPAPAKQAPPEKEKSKDLEIQLSKITENASFYTIDVDGTTMEVLAVKAPDGTVRTAFNTCQVCYDSGRGYYVQQGNMLVCQNCGNQFPMSQVEVQAGGCNPWPIFAKDKTVTDKTITIPYSFLKENAQYFSNWKKL
jgi:hypothetical protein